jgi:hypothetical protein
MHRAKPKDGEPGAELYWKVKEKVREMQKAGELK